MGAEYAFGPMTKFLEVEGQHTQCHRAARLKMVKNGKSPILCFTGVKKSSPRKRTSGRRVFLTKSLLLVQEKLPGKDSPNGRQPIHSAASTPRMNTRFLPASQFRPLSVRYRMYSKTSKSQEIP